MTPALFQYDDLRPTEAQEVRAAAERIRVRMKRTAEDIVAIGQDLLSVKARLPHGAFLPWISAEFGMSQQSASRFMSVAEAYTDKLPKLGNLSLSAIYELAAPSTPDTVRQVIEARAETGEAVSVEEVKRLKREAAEAVKRAEDAEAKAADAQARADNLLDGQQALVARAKADAEAKAKADLDTAKAEAAAAQRTLEAERRKLTEAAAKAAQAALERAKAEAANFAKAALAEVEADARKAKQAEAEARQRVEKLTASADRLAARVKEHDDALKKMKGADIEAGALRDRMTEVIRVVTMAMGDIHDIEHEHGPEVHQSMARAAGVCRQFAEALDHFSGPRLVYDREGAQA